MLDEPIQANGENDPNFNDNILELTNHNKQQQNSSTLNPLEELLFGNSTQKHQSNNGNYLSTYFFF